MYAAMPWLQASDLPTARAWARLELIIDTVYAILHTIGPMNGQAEPRRLLGEWRQLQQAQLAYARELGMTPAARMAIKASGTSAALDLAGIAEPVSDRVIEVGQARGKLTPATAVEEAEVADGNAKPRSG